MSIAVATAVATSMKGYRVDRPVTLSGLCMSEMPLPSVSDDGVLVRVHASSANPVDLFPLTRAGYLMGGRKPSVAGTDFAGVVELVGPLVTAFRVGDEVFGGSRGAYAEYVCASESGALAMKPASVTFEEAGVVAVAGCTALQAVRDHGQIAPGHRVLVNGASGGVGTFAVQIAAALGGEVTAVCSPRNVELVRSLGASAVIDYTRTDFTASNERYDLLIDVAGSHSFMRCRRVIAPGGSFVAAGVAAVQHRPGGNLRAIGHLLGTRVMSMAGGVRARFFIANLNRADMEFLGKLMAEGKLKPAIDRRYAFDEVPAALQYMNEGHARAKIAIAVGAG